MLAVAGKDPGSNGTEIEDALRLAGVTFQKGEERAAMRALEAAGRLVHTPGKRGAKLWWLPEDVPTSPTSQASPSLPTGKQKSLPKPPL